MEDQVVTLREKGFGACVAYINSDLSQAEVRQIYRRVRNGELALLYVTPERFRSRAFRDALEERMVGDNGLEYVIFDEAHCIAQWGNDFRPDYHNALKQFAQKQRDAAPSSMIALFSATISSYEEEEYRRLLPNLKRLGQAQEDYNPVRQHIDIGFAETEHNDDARMEKIVEYIQEHTPDFTKSRMMVFCHFRRQCEECATALDDYCEESDEPALATLKGHIGYYHAGMLESERSQTYRNFLPQKNDRDEATELYLLFCTKAFGMGMDIPNIHYCLHFTPPQVLEDYLQEVGRAGRNKEQYENAFPQDADAQRQPIPARCLISDEDFKKLKEQLNESQLAWSHLTECKTKIVAYLQQYRPLEVCQGNPVVVPWDVWLKDSTKLVETTATRLVFHWLEKAGCIRLGFYDMLPVDMTLTEQGSHKVGPALQRLYQTLLQYAHVEGTRVLVPLTEVRREWHMSLSRSMDSLLELEKAHALELHGTLRCRLEPRRYGEVLYMCKYPHDDQRFFALHIYLGFLAQLLQSTWPTGSVVEISSEDRDRLATDFDNYVQETYQYAPNMPGIHEQVTITKKGKKKRELYMPWHDNDIIGTLPDYAVTRYATFVKDLKEKSLRRCFLILLHVPGVQLKDTYETQYLRVTNRQWRPFLTQLEADCRTWLRSMATEGKPLYTWSQHARALGLLDRGFDYFCTVLAILRSLGYIEHTPLLPSGIQIYATPTTADEIDEGTQPNSPLHAVRQEFDAQERLKKSRLTCMNVFSQLREKKDRNTFIQRYFQCKTIDAYMALLGEYAQNEDILRELNEEALTLVENRLNPHQKTIYDYSIQRHINVLAGPGSGKTHVLTLRCAKLIYREKVDPQQVLVLAYNRAVVVELRTRLDRLFGELGLSRLAHRIPVFTFHGLAKKCLGTRLEGIKPENWDTLFEKFLQEERGNFRALFPVIKHVLVDEFQDINRSRLSYLQQLHEMYPDAVFFTIGDKNQSIYGFDRIPKGEGERLAPEDYAAMLDPQPYYDTWEGLIQPVSLTMFTNYRSYQKILDFAADAFLPEAAKATGKPTTDEALQRYAPATPYVVTEDVPHAALQGHLENKIRELIAWARAGNDSGEAHRRVRTIAVFFRTNAELYEAYSWLRTSIPADVRLRIQGTDVCEMWRKREFFEVLGYLKKRSNSELYEYTQLKTTIEKGIKYYDSIWDTFYLDVLDSIIHNYYDQTYSESSTHTFAELVEYITDVCGHDEGGQIYKIYEEYHKDDMPLSLVLTTMHKVKGLEFDAVIVTPSDTALPLGKKEDAGVLSAKEQAELEEEKRLMFVACTRARKYLHVYQGQREKCLLANAPYLPEKVADARFFEKEPGLDNYFLSYLAWNNRTAALKELQHRLPMNAPARIQRRGRLCCIVRLMHSKFM